MAGCAIVLSFALIQVDSVLSAETVKNLDLLYTFGPEGARAILSAIASSMITVAGLTFSITMLTLQLASSQFGPRVLRNFMRDRGNQLVLGTFISTFVYCLLVLRTVRGEEGSSFVPHLSVAFGVLFALASIAVLIYFIHHVASSIRIETLLAQLAAEARSSIDRLYPERLGYDPPSPTEESLEPPIPNDFERAARRICSEASGYVQRVDVDALMRIAVEHDIVVRIDARPGRFVVEDDAVFAAHPPDRVVDDVVDELRRTLVVGQERTPEQDLQFSIRRIVEIAQRALSPGVNDPTTAIYCVDRLGEALERLAGREIPSSTRFDDERRLRILSQVVSFDELACSSFAAIARYGIKDADVVARLRVAIERVAAAARPGDAGKLVDLSQAIRNESRKQLVLEFDREAVSATAPPRGSR